MRKNLRSRMNWSIGIVVAAIVLISASVQSSLAKETGESKSTLEQVLKPAIEAHHGDVGLAVKHLKTGESYEYMADRPMPTASLIKLPVMITVFDAVDKDKLSLSEMLELKKSDQVPGS